MCGPGAPWTPPPRGLSHATPLGGCCVTVHDPFPAHAGGSCHPCQGVSPTLGIAQTHSVEYCIIQAIWRARVPNSSTPEAPRF